MRQPQKLLASVLTDACRVRPGVFSAMVAILLILIVMGIVRTHGKFEAPPAEQEPTREASTVGTPADALVTWSSGLAIFRTMKGTERNQALCYQNMGVALEEMGRYEEALQHQVQALAILATIDGADAEERACWGHMGDAQRGAKRYAEAIAAYDKAGSAWWISRGRALAYAARGEPGDRERAVEHLLQALQQVRTERSSVLAVEPRTGVFKRAIAVFGEAVDMMVGLGGEQAVVTHPDVTRWAEGASAASALLCAAFHFADEGKSLGMADVLREKQAVSGRKSPSVLHGVSDFRKPMEMARELEPDRAVLQYSVGEKAGWLLLMTSEGVTAHKLGAPMPALPELLLRQEASVNQLVASWTQRPEQVGIDGLVRLARVRAEDLGRREDERLSLVDAEQEKAILERLGGLVLPDSALTELRRTRSRRLLVIPDGNLHDLSFAMLRLKSDKEQNAHYLIEEFAVSYVPAMATLEPVRRQAAARSAKLRTESRDRPAPAKSADSAGPAVADTQLNADVVMLPAGHTGLGRLRSGEGLTGLGAAFFITGAPSVCATLWRAPTESTNQLVAEFFRQLKDGRTDRAEALRQAQLAVLQSGKDPGGSPADYSTPFCWAGFVLLGEYRPLEVRQATAGGIPAILPPAESSELAVMPVPAPPVENEPPAEPAASVVAPSPVPVAPSPAVEEKQAAAVAVPIAPAPAAPAEAAQPPAPVAAAPAAAVEKEPSAAAVVPSMPPPAEEAQPTVSSTPAAPVLVPPIRVPPVANELPAEPAAPVAAPAPPPVPESVPVAPPPAVEEKQAVAATVPVPPAAEPSEEVQPPAPVSPAPAVAVEKEQSAVAAVPAVPPAEEEKKPSASVALPVVAPSVAKEPPAEPAAPVAAPAPPPVPESVPVAPPPAVEEKQAAAPAAPVAPAPAAPAEEALPPAPVAAAPAAAAEKEPSAVSSTPDAPLLVSPLRVPPADQERPAESVAPAVAPPAPAAPLPEVAEKQPVEPDVLPVPAPGVAKEKPAEAAAPVAAPAPTPVPESVPVAPAPAVEEKQPVEPVVLPVPVLSAEKAKPAAATVPVLPVLSSAGPVEGQKWTVPDVGMEFVWIPALECWVGKYETTNGEYRRFRPGHDSKDHKGKSLNNDRQPVVNVTVEDAGDFANWLTQRERAADHVPEELRFRLPTRDEWTALAECGDGRVCPWGNDWPPKFGNYADHAAQLAFADKTAIDGYDDGFAVTCPVEQSGRNAWGLYGVGGNVWECTAVSSEGGFVEWRGAAWDYGMRAGMRCSFRLVTSAANRANDCGFRLLLSH